MIFISVVIRVGYFISLNDERNAEPSIEESVGENSEHPNVGGVRRE